ncbi:family 31 glycosyl hydrolase, alpha-glucosidase [Thioflavicoccus mobilis 8321]|uniref:Family 31 glycosyl hydrolase, alpha-glucosidase n=1 Tax=Thioflavicoccus mobilis 8321 TaxID=765912 RepID=L0GX79_9GAMM|nr:TIM-barrel domain-containing protein [Thioflavicoccus mobilis]AGA90581.1 family 31 glycosyl hydrolase, alpha-glucosidase [Thioflavicoccus mobilis 8321]
MPDPLLAHPGPVQTWERQPSSLLARHEQGLTQIDAVAPDILRVRFCPSGEPRPRRGWDPTLELPATELGVSGDDDALHLFVDRLVARLDCANGTLAFAIPDGNEFAEDLAPPGWRAVTLGETALGQTPDTELPPGPARIGLFLSKRMSPDERYFGLGQRPGRLDRRHRRFTNWTVDISSPGHCRGDDNMYQAHPVFLAVRPRLAWGLFLNSPWYSTFDVGASDPNALTLFTLGGELDYYLFAGPTPAAVVDQLTRVTGRPALPPLWALGYHQSRWSYASDAEVHAIAQTFRERDIPLDAIHLDIDYMDGYRVFTWDPQRFPAPTETVAALHARGVRAVTIVDPGVKKDLTSGYRVAEDGLREMHFIREPQGEPFSGWVWPGESLFPDFCRTDTRRWWGDQHAALLDAGVDGIWCDMNEPAIVDRAFGAPGEQARPIPLAARHGDAGEAQQAETHNLYGTLMARAAAEGFARQRPDRRPWVLTRSGFLGVQRWAASWMGDNRSCWEDLETSLPQLASMGLCGSVHVGVDIGGFYGDCFAELFARWMEVGTFYPFMRNHTQCGSRPQEPWAFGPQIEALTRAAIRLRYRLLPYLYTLAHLAHHRGEPLLRPLLYDFPDAADLHQIEDQLMVGPQLMIAPIYRPGVRRRLVELPPATWYDFRTGMRIAEQDAMIAAAPLGALPVFVRGGAILTLGNVRRSTIEPLTELTIEAYPDPDAAGEWTLIEDDGEGLDYRNGGLAERHFEIASLRSGATLTIAARAGGYRPPPRRLTVRVHLPDEPADLRLDGHAHIAWRWSATDQAAEITFDDDGDTHRIEIIP